jgi:hypothetical protein
MTAASSVRKTPRDYQTHGLNTMKRAIKSLGSRMIDQRTRLGKALAKWRLDLVRDLGGESAISTQQTALIDLAVKSKLLLDSIDTWLLTQPSLVNARKKCLLAVVRERQALADGLARYLAQLGLAFNIAIDVNTADNGEILDLFEVFINCSDPNCSTGTRIYHYDADGNIGSLSANGNGYADWTLRTVDLTGLNFTNIKFHAIWNNASDGGESFFLVAGTPNQGCTTNCFATVPEPSGLILMGLGLVLTPAVIRMV